MSLEETADLCFKSVRTVKSWDLGKPIPPECKRLMRIYKSRCICDSEEWEQFVVRKNKLVLPTGKAVSPQEIILGAALIEISSIDELNVMRKVLKYSRALVSLKK